MSDTTHHTVDLQIFSRILRPRIFVYGVLDVPKGLRVRTIINEFIWPGSVDIFKKLDISSNDLYLEYLEDGLDIDPRETLPQRLTDYRAASQTRLLDDLHILEEPSCGKAQIQLVLHVERRTPTPKPRNAAEEAHEKTLLGITQSPAPSSLGSSSALADFQAKTPIYNGRHDHLHTTPLILYNPVLAVMKERLEDLSKVVQPTSARLALTAQLFAVATNIHATEDLRQKAMMPFLEGLLGKLEQQLPARDKHNKIVAKGDFVRVLTHPDGTSRYAIEGELKNGFLGNAPMQASVAYAWRIAQPAYDDVRKTTCCPAVILSFIGPYFHVSGVALVDIMIVQSFTDLIYLGGDPFAESQVLRVTKIFDVVAAAIKDLKTYYTDIAPSAIPDSSRLMPKPVPDNNLLILEERFLYQGGRPDSRRSLFRGTYDGAPVLVKFCERYNRTAHTLLAEHDPPLAPKLHLVSEVQGGLKMVVMDFIERQDAHYQFEDQYLPPGVRADVSLAITVLRDAGLVFGDLRRPNILVVPRKHEGEGGDFGAMLVDFDWAGKAGEDRYPLLINVSGDIQWANGVGPGEIMEFKHDVDMFDRLDS